MKLPRDISGKDLIKALSCLDYQVTRQTGSHIRLTTQLNGKHSITVPVHDPIKIELSMRFYEILANITNLIAIN